MDDEEDRFIQNLRDAVTTGDALMERLDRLVEQDMKARQAFDYATDRLHAVIQNLQEQIRTLEAMRNHSGLLADLMEQAKGEIERRTPAGVQA